MVLSKIKRRVASSKLLFQQNFDRASDASAFSAHYKATIFALLFLGCAILVVGPVRSDYWVAQSLLKHGLTTNGTIESADVTTRPGKGSRHVTTVDYRFVGPDGQVYRGSSTYQGDKPQRAAKGDSRSCTIHSAQVSAVGELPLKGSKPEFTACFSLLSCSFPGASFGSTGMRGGDSIVDHSQHDRISSAAK